MQRIGYLKLVLQYLLLYFGNLPLSLSFLFQQLSRNVLPFRIFLIIHSFFLLTLLLLYGRFSIDRSSGSLSYGRILMIESIPTIHSRFRA